MGWRLRPLVFAASLCASLGAASADGLEAPRLQVPIWTGFYANGGIGYGVWEADTTTVSAATGACVLCATQDQGGKGWLGEAGLGYDRQLTSKFVGGLFASFALSNVEGTIQDQGPFLAGKIANDSAWFVGARLGWLMTPAILNYYSAGFTHAHFDGASMNNTGGVVTPPVAPGFKTSDYDSGGWFLGSGLEVSVGGGWFWRSEVRYARYGRKTLTDTNAGTGGTLDSITFEPTVQTATTHIIYKFNSGH